MRKFNLLAAGLLVVFGTKIIASGSSTLPTAYFHPGVLDFTIGITSTQTTTLTNTSTQSLVIRGFALLGGKANDFTMQTTCGTSLAAGASCDVTLTGFASRTGLLGKLVEYDNSAAGQHQVLLEANEGAR